MSAVFVGRDADAGVGDGEMQHAVGPVGSLHPHPDDHFPRFGELDGVADEVDQHLPEPSGIGRARGRARRRRRRTAARAASRAPAAPGLRIVSSSELSELERRGVERQPPGLDLREVENVVDDLEQGIGRGLDHAQVLALLAAQLGVQRQLRHADDAVHRRPDFVAHVGEELALRAAAFLGPVSGAHKLTVHGDELGCPRFDLFLEVRLMALQL